MRVIFSHAGGTLPFLINRFVRRTRNALKNHRPANFHSEIQKFHYDTAQAFHSVPMTALRGVVPLSQILFGTDWPYRTSSETVIGLVESDVFTTEELYAIDRENPLRLMPQFAVA